MKFKDSLTSAYWAHVEQHWEKTMPYEHRDNTGSVFKNDNKPSENHPDYSGDGMINGQVMRIAIWVKTASTGRKFLSLAFSESQKYPKKDYAPDQGLENSGDFGDDIPFS